MATIIKCNLSDCIHNRFLEICQADVIGIDPLEVGQAESPAPKTLAVCDSYFETPEALQKHLDKGE
jgi:hypothetical protein